MTNQTAKITKYLSKCESRVYTNVKGGNRGSGGSFYDDNHGKKNLMQV
jgi:coproporphyrinogen III oxidase